MGQIYGKPSLCSRATYKIWDPLYLQALQSTLSALTKTGFSLRNTTALLKNL
jgi:hypothetical protein